VFGTVPPTLRDETVNVALVEPAATSTVGGTVVSLPAVSETDAPPEGAAAVSVAVPVTESPPTTLAALNEIDESAADTTAAGGTTTPTGGAAAVGAVVEPPHCTMAIDASSVPTSEATVDRVWMVIGYFLSRVTRSKISPPTPPAAAPTPAPFLPPASAPMAVPAPALPPMISASFSHDRLFEC